MATLQFLGGFPLKMYEILILLVSVVLSVMADPCTFGWTVDIHPSSSFTNASNINRVYYCKFTHPSDFDTINDSMKYAEALILSVDPGDNPDISAWNNAKLPDFNDCVYLKEEIGYHELCQSATFTTLSIPKLQYLEISHNAYKKLKQESNNSTFKLNTSLALTENIFDNVGKIVELILSDIGVTNLTAGVFNKLELLKTLDLSHAGVQVLPNNAFQGCENLERLLLNNNFLGYSQPYLKEIGAFNGLVKLAELNLRHNFIRTLNMGIFDDLNKLHILSLAENDISEIQQLTFSNLKELTELDLSDNKLSNVPSVHLHSYLKNLTTLYTLNLSGNKISNIYIDNFEIIAPIKTLNLSNNLIQTIDEHSFVRLKHLKTLDLSENVFTYVEPDTLAGIDDVSVIYLNGNKINTIDDSAFYHLTNLEKLYLNDNKLLSLTELSLHVNESVNPYVNLSGNPWDCDPCGPTWMIQRVIDQGDGNITKCSTPAQYAGRTFLDLIVSCSYVEECALGGDCVDDTPPTTTASAVFTTGDDLTQISTTVRAAPEEQKWLYTVMGAVPVGVILLIMILLILCCYCKKCCCFAGLKKPADYEMVARDGPGDMLYLERDYIIRDRKPDPMYTIRKGVPRDSIIRKSYAYPINPMDASSQSLHYSTQRTREKYLADKLCTPRETPLSRRHSTQLPVNARKPVSKPIQESFTVADMSGVETEEIGNNTSILDHIFQNVRIYYKQFMYMLHYEQKNNDES